VQLSGVFRALLDNARELRRTQRELDRLREDLEYLTAEFRRFRGKVTGGMRSTPAQDDDYEIVEVPEDELPRLPRHRSA
jgi:hypothetical protein